MNPNNYHPFSNSRVDAPVRGAPTFRAPYNSQITAVHTPVRPGAGVAAPFNSQLTALHTPVRPGHVAAPANSALTGLRAVTGPGSSAAPSNSQAIPHAAGNANFSAPANSQVTPGLHQLTPMARALVTHALRLHGQAQSGASGRTGPMSPPSVSNPMMYRNGMLG